MRSLVVACCIAVTAGCAATPHRDWARISPLAVSEAVSEFGCTPLPLTIHAPGRVAAGSGVLVHPRVVVTANHIVLEGATSVGSQVELAGGRVVIEKVIRGAERGFWEGDWAIIVLANPFGSLGAVPATRLAEPDRPSPSPGMRVTIAGLPVAPGTNDPMERRPVTISAVVVERPGSAMRSDDVWFARNTADEVSRPGASGSPVFADEDGVPVLIGLYSGTADQRTLGIRRSNHLVIQRLPTGAIREVVAEVGT